jgi:hypothetical protein
MDIQELLNNFEIDDDEIVLINEWLKSENIFDNMVLA